MAIEMKQVKIQRIIVKKEGWKEKKHLKTMKQLKQNPTQS